MKHTKTLTRLVLCLSLLGLGVWLVTAPPGGAAIESAGAGSEVTPALQRITSGDAHYAWRAGESLAYDVDLDAEITTSAGTDTHHQTVAFDATLQLRVLEVVDGRARLELSVPRTRAFTIVVDEQLVAESGANAGVFAHERIHLWVNHRGEILDEQLAEETPAPVASIILGAARELLPDVGRVGEFQEQGLLGTGVITSHTRQRLNITEVHRERSEYVEVDAFPESGAARATSTTVASFDDDGRLVTLSLNENAVLPEQASWTWTLSALARRPETFTVTQTLLASTPETAASGAAAALDDLRLRVGDMTPESFLEDLFNLPASGRFLDHNAWLYKAGGLLSLYPELCEELASLILDEGALSRQSQLLGLDLLAGVGSSEAQASLRQVVRSEAMRARDDYSRVIQSAVLIGVHDHETLRTYEDLSEQLPGHQRASAMAMLGHLGGVAATSGDASSAARVARQLETALHAAEGEDEVLDALRGLGNLGTTEAERAVEPFLNDESDWTRGAAARALRNVDSDSSRELLWGVVADQSDAVRSQAIRALGGRGFSSDDVGRLHEWLAGGVSESDVVALLESAERMEDREAQEGLLLAMLDAATLSGSTIERISGQLPRDMLASASQR